MGGKCWLQRSCVPAAGRSSLHLRPDICRLPPTVGGCLGDASQAVVDRPRCAMQVLQLAVAGCRAVGEFMRQRLLEHTEVGGMDWHAAIERFALHLAAATQ